MAGADIQAALCAWRSVLGADAVLDGAAAGAADGRVARRGFPPVTHPVLSEKSG